MKKTLSLILILSCVFLAACKPPYYYDYDDLKERIEKVEIIEINFENRDSSYLIAESLKILDDEEKDELLLGLTKIKFSSPYEPKTSLSGYCIKMWCKNGEFEVIGALTVSVFDSDSKYLTGYWRTCFEDALYELISEYVDLPSEIS